MSSYQYRKSHCGDKTILRPSYLRNGISYTGKTASLYWIRAQASLITWHSNAILVAVNWVIIGSGKGSIHLFGTKPFLEPPMTCKEQTSVKLVSKYKIFFQENVSCNLVLSHQYAKCGSSCLGLNVLMIPMSPGRGNLSLGLCNVVSQGVLET